MPVQPSTWYPGPMSPQQLNVDLYSFNGTGYGANGLLFHAHRPVMHESMSASKLMTVSTSGTWNFVPGAGTSAFNIIDTGALFGLGSENPGNFALYQFTPNVVAGAGIGYQPGNVSPTGVTVPTYPQGAGGNYLVSHFITGQTASATPAAIGAGMYYDPGFLNLFQAQGGIQPHTAGTQGAAYYLDLMDAGGGCSGTLASPIAQQQINSMFLPQGNGWVVDWAVEVLNTASTSDGSNFTLMLGTSTLATSTNLGAIGTYVQAPVTVNSTGTGAYLAVAAGTNTPTSQTTYGFSIYGYGVPSIGNAYTWQPGAYYADGSATSEQPPFSAADTAGFTPRHTWTWAGVSYQGLLVSANSNAYAANQNLAGWSSPNATLTAVTPPGNPPQQPSGVLVTPSGTATTANAIAGSFPATAGSVYQVTAQFFLPVVQYSVQTGVNWYNAAGGFLSTTSGPAALTSLAVWTPNTSWNTAPTSAATGLPWGQLAAASGNVPATVTTYLAGVVAVGGVPAPQATWTNAITSVLMNGQNGPQQALALLNNPPALRCAQGLTTSIANSAATSVAFSSAPTSVTGPGIDSYAAYSTSSGVYTAPLNGLYLAFATLPFTANSTGVRYAGFKVISNGTTTTFQGPATSAVGSAAGVTSASVFRVLDLQANDTITPQAFQNSGGSLGLSAAAPGYLSRFGLLYLCPVLSTGVAAFTPPVTSFHWFAGITAATLEPFLNTHLGNDLNFLLNRPYLTAYQTTAQTGLVNGSWNVVTMSPAGLLHQGAGDNYGGWNSTSSAYTAVQPGWYLVMAEVYAALPTAATGFIYAGIKCSTSGGIAPSTSPDQYQTMFFPQTGAGTPVPGAAAIGVYYLAAGESIQAMIKCANWGGNFSTFVQTSPRVNSQLTVLWIAE